MNNNCINLKKKMKQKNYYIFCKKRNGNITFEDCKNCPYKEFKKSVYNSKMKERTYKQAKKEKNRYSLFTDNLDTCIECGKHKDHLHEIFGGRNRSNSIKYGLVIPLCSACHRKVHDNPVLIAKWHKKGQTIFNQVYPNLNFIDIFFRNYLK